jgi:signal transduction histidine kinase/CheY-like chemotaxis protein
MVCPGAGSPGAGARVRLTMPGMVRILRAAARVHLPAIAVLCVATAGTLLVTWQLDGIVRTKDEERFSNSADRLQDAVQARIEMYVAMLRAGAALFDVAPDLSEEAFREFVVRLEIRERYPGIQGIGFTRRVLPDELPALESSRRASGHPDFSVWPDDPRDEYHAIVYLEPLDRRNRAAIGFDMFTEEVRRQAMARARDTGEPAASGPVTLVQEIDGDVQHGFLIYMPVYAGGAVPLVLADRQDRLLGFVYSPFRAGDLFAGILGGDRHPRAGFDLFDDGAPDLRLYRTSPRENPWFTTSREVDVEGRPWTLSIFSLEALEESSSAALVPLVRWSGILISLLLAALVALQTQARQRLETQAEILAGLYARVQQLLESERLARGDAERVSRLKDEFLATLSHELRTPLNAIQGWAHVLGLPALPPAKRDHALDAILRSAHMQARLIEDLLDMSRIISGRIRLESHEVRLGDALDASISAVRPAAESKGVTIDLRPEGDSPVVRGDANRLQQVFGNLLSNAVKFTPAGGRVTVTPRVLQGHAVVDVVDTGIGIDQEFLPHMFERFRQGDGSITRRHGGLGLGLSIAKSLVQLHGGTIAAASQGIGHGATLTVTLPLAPAAAPDAPEPPPAPELSAVPLVPDMLAGLTVLAVDDDADARELMRNMLTAYGAEVVVAADAEEALETFRRQPDRFRLLVSDIGMPGMDGYGLLREIRRHGGRGSSIPAVAVTAYASAEDAARARAAGYRVHVPKPATPHDIVAACAIAGDRVVL